MNDKTREEMTIEAQLELKRQMFSTAAVLTTCAVLSFVFAPDVALAQDVGFASIIESLRTLVSIVLLPVGILIAGWRIAYLAVFCAMGGIDPLDMLGKGGGEVKTSEAVQEIKANLVGFVKGLAWVGGIWIVFQFALGIAQVFANTLASI